MLNSFSGNSEILRFHLTVFNIISILSFCVYMMFLSNNSILKECVFSEKVSFSSVTPCCYLQTCHSADNLCGSTCASLVQILCFLICHDLTSLSSFLIVYVGSHGQQKLMYLRIWRMTLQLLLSPMPLFLSHQLARLRMFSTATGARLLVIQQRRRIFPS